MPIRPTEDFPISVVADLVELGRASDPGMADVSVLDRLGPYERANWVGIDGWRRLMHGLPAESVVAAVRGIVIGEKRLGWRGGSAASAIWAYHVAASLLPAEADALADWCLKHSDNPYVPFNSNRGDIRSVEEYRQALFWGMRRQAQVAREEEATRKRAALRAWLRQQDHQQRLARQRAEAESRRTRLQELAAFSPTDRLTIIAWDALHPPDYYPAEFFPTDPAVVNSLEPAAQASLLGKHASSPWWRRWHRHMESVLRDAPRNENAQ